MSPHAPPLHESQALKLMVNGTLQTTTATTLHDWVLAQGVASDAVATAVNGQFVPRTQRAATVLQAGDAILTFQPIVGG